MEKKVPVINYARVVGYYRPTVQFNEGKKQEFEERKLLSREDICESNSESEFSCIFRLSR